ncbi:hypothetical protein [Pseudoalteromonas spongiae]|uniref:Uncharacterized protein n=1 Tax=Pseudoalteromonas spongiae TaxID=298657 RepID=A0ABU8ESI2_9GAMM
MHKFVKFFFLLTLGTILFHFFSVSVSFVYLNWIVETDLFPDQKSFLWSLELSLPSSFIFSFCLAFALLMNKWLLDLKSSNSLKVVVTTSVTFALFIGLLKNIDIPTNSYLMLLVFLVPLVITALLIAVLKVTKRVWYS